MEVASSPVSQPYALSAGEGQAVWFGNNRATIKASAASTGGVFGLVEVLAAPGHAPPLHIHPTEDEPMWVLEGQLTVQCGDQTFAAGPGSFIHTPRGVAHTFRVEGSTPARLLVLVIPGGMEGYFVDAGRPAEAEGLPPPAPLDIARLQAAGAKYHMEFVGPPLGASSAH